MPTTGRTMDSKFGWCANMGTRSFIGVDCSDGIRGTYCHWDGYLEHNGKILKESYTDFLKVCELIHGGQISSLGPEIGEKHSFDDDQENETTYYYRDRGDDYVAPEVYQTEAEFVEDAMNSWAEYIYLFKNGKWYYTQSDVESFREV